MARIVKILSGLFILVLLVLSAFFGDSENGYMTRTSAREIASEPAVAAADRPKASRPSPPQTVRTAPTASARDELGVRPDAGTHPIPSFPWSPVDTKPIQDDWSREPEDVTWTKQQHAYMESMFKDLEIDGQIAQVSCRQTICKINLVLADLGMAARLSDGAGDGEYERFVDLRQEEGRVAIDVYLRRKQD